MGTLCLSLMMATSLMGFLPTRAKSGCVFISRMSTSIGSAPSSSRVVSCSPNRTRTLPFQSKVTLNTWNVFNFKGNSFTVARAHWCNVQRWWRADRWPECRRIRKKFRSCCPDSGSPGQRSRAIRLSIKGQTNRLSIISAKQIRITLSAKAKSWFPPSRRLLTSKPFSLTWPEGNGFSSFFKIWISLRNYAFICFMAVYELSFKKVYKRCSYWEEIPVRRRCGSEWLKFFRTGPVVGVPAGPAEGPEVAQMAVWVRPVPAVWQVGAVVSVFAAEDRNSKCHLSWHRFWGLAVDSRRARNIWRPCRPTAARNRWLHASDTGTGRSTFRIPSTGCTFRLIRAE